MSSSIALFACESDTARELKKGEFKIYHQKTPPTNIVLEDIHETDSEEVKQIKQIINELRTKLGNSTDLIKIEPETALFNILYTKNEIDQLMISSGSGFNLPLFLHSVLISGAKLIKTSDGTSQNAEKYTELFNVAADNFEHIYKTFNDYDDRMTGLEDSFEILDNEVETLTERTEELEDTVSKISSCECDHEWMKFMQKNFTANGLFDDEVNVNCDLLMNGNDIHDVGNIHSKENTFIQVDTPKLRITSGTIEALNIPAELQFVYNSRKDDTKEADFLDGSNNVVDYNTYGVWYQACDSEVMGSIDVDNRLRINKIEDNKKVSTMDVGAMLEDHEIRIKDIEESGGGGGGETGYWKKNAPRMERLPEHITLEAFDFDQYASTITFKKISEQYSLIYFPNLVSIDLDYDRYQFITIKGLTENDVYITSKDKQLILPLVNSLSFGEVFMQACDLHNVGILWRNKQPVERNIGVEFTLNNGYARFDSEIYKGTEEEPTTLYLDEYDSSDNLLLELIIDCS